jgi:membrane protease YdiL (CAAX protease family)
LWTWVVFVIATPIVGLASSQVLSLLVDEMSDQLKMMEGMMQAHTDNFLMGLILIVAVVPGVVEELMFRGYIQSRLAERWNAMPAIVVSALFFSAAHLDPIHMLGVIPLGLWLGAVAWRADSVWPAMICHSANNAVAVIGTKYEQMPTLGFTLDPMTVGALAISLPAFLLSLYIFRSN